MDSNKMPHEQNINLDKLPNFVVCFDRDYTVSVNPHPKQQAVPLSWVKHLAHEQTEVDVWATGNQLLREEAAIPGISEAITSWRELTLPDSVEQFHEYVPPQARKPSRKEGLRLVKVVYDEITAALDIDIQFIVIDDVDLTQLESEGWKHYFPWDFVSVIKNETTSVSVPIPLEEVSEIPLTKSDCPESYPPLDYDTPKPLTYLSDH